MRRSLLLRLPAGLALALVAAATWKLTLGDRIIARGDLLLYFYPLRDYASAALREGRLPLWNPYTFMGAPFLANSQAGFFYPLNILLAWLPVERAVSWSIALHLGIAALGAFALARNGMRLSRLASFAGAVVFSLGGYLGAQVEHLNQLQVLAWLPLEMLCLMTLRRDNWPRRGLALALLIGLQVLAGHTQSLYISLVALGIVALVDLAAATLDRCRAWRSRRSSARTSDSRPSTGPQGNTPPDTPWVTGLLPLGVLAAAGILAAVISAAQLLPTLELATQSARSGGLPYNEVGSFSWRPWVAARALLPTYGDPLFAEYVAYLGAVGLALAMMGVVSRQSSVVSPQNTEYRTQNTEHRAQTAGGQRRSKVMAMMLVGVGLVLAFGIATPVFGVLVRFMPGFNLFRAQARWLILFALGASMLAGLGVQALQSGLTTRERRRWLAGWLALVAILVAGVILGTRISPEPEYQTLPAPPVLAGWGIAIAVTTVLIALSNLKSLFPNLYALLFVTCLVVELLAASQFQPYARASDRGALTDLRPATAHLLAEQAAGRILALSGLFFDPGDLPEQTLIYQAQLTQDELYDRVIASKHKEILSPNLSLYYRLPSVDGYDGGLLPLRRYADFVQQFAPQGKARTADGRLRELLNAVPANPWLEQMAVRYIIADKTQDVFFENVFYDLLFSQPLSEPLTITLDPFESTALGIVLSAPQARPSDALASATVAFRDGTSQSFELRATAAVTQPYFNLRLDWGGRNTPASVAFVPRTPGVMLRGLTSIDSGAGVFLSHMVRGEHDMRLVHSGDVKIYENLRAAQRAEVVSRQSTVESRLMTFDFRLSTDDFPQIGRITMTVDVPERAVFEVEAAEAGRLVVRDACYPGWVTRVDGVEAPITCTDILFRSVDVPAGRHQVTFDYEPMTVKIGLLASAAGLLAWIALAIRSRQSTVESRKSTDD